MNFEKDFGYPKGSRRRIQNWSRRICFRTIRTFALLKSNGG